MKWEYVKKEFSVSNGLRFTLEKTYHIDERKNVLFLCRQTKINGDWQTVAVKRFYFEN